MKKIYIISLSLLIICVSCNRSQFSVTSRHYRKGKVIYVHHHPAEHDGSYKMKGVKRNAGKVVTQPRSLSESRNIEPLIPVSGILQMDNAGIPDEEKLLAANTAGTTRLAHSNIRTNRNDVVIPSKKDPGSIVLVKKVPGTGPVYPAPALTKSDPVDIKALLGFIFSILGWIPAIGLIFAIAAIILSAISLHQFYTGSHWGARSGRWLAISGLVIGILAVIFNIILIAAFISNMTFEISGLGW